jgi:phenylpropionate dioxygenase-like ring-hydroxylating dioxygenase large terminal subunit
MLSADDNRTLTRTDRGTPMGEYFRRFWQPVALSRELPGPDSPPLRVTNMGEDLVAFRDTEGRVGLVDPRCPHRGADLFFGRNEECGLRCVYHGWKFDVQGHCVDLPNAQASAAFLRTVRITAYPTREAGDLVWAYLGPGVPPEALPALEFTLVPESHRYVMKKLQVANWAQSIEGGLDASHFSFLHMPAPSLASDANPSSPAGEQRLRWIREDPQPEFSFADHEVGFVYGAGRRAGPGERYWRTAQYMVPNHATTPSTFPGETYYGYTFVPIRDDSCWIYTYAWNPERPIDPAERAKFPGGYNVLADVDERWVPRRNRDNGYLQDREDQKHRTFTGVRGIAEQDAMVQESQGGGMADRTREHLTAGDAAIVRFRRIVLGGAKALAGGVEPSAPHDARAYTRRSGSWIAGDDVPFDEVMVKRFGDPTGHAGSR